ncbi:MAG TPA: S9 family peptidase [Kofleriaceae bacterium]|nr:S9 family peptidase [Kofleriaceae bacterium]
MTTTSQPVLLKRSALELLLFAGCSNSQTAARGASSVATSGNVGQAVGHPSDKLIPRATLFGNPQRAGVQLSHDGKWISWLAPVDGVMNVWAAPLNALDQAAPLTHETKRPVRSYVWAYTNAHVLYLQDAGGDENFHVFRVALRNGKADGDAVDLTPQAGARVELAAASYLAPSKVMITENDRNPEMMDVYSLDIATGERKLVLRNDEGFSDFSFDHTMTVTFGTRMTPDGGSAIMRRTGDKWVPFQTVGMADSMTTAMVGPVGESSDIYMLDSRGRDTAALVQLDATGQKQSVLAENALADAGDALVHPTTDLIQAIAFDYEKPSWKLLDPSIAPDVKAIQAFAPDAWSIGSRTVDDKLWLVTASSATQPARYFLWNRATQKQTFLFSARPELDAIQLAPMSSHVIKARDGKKLVSYLTLPRSADPDGDGRANAPVPMVLMVHGGPWARDEYGYNAIHQLLANRGYAVLAVNFRGSTGFGKAFINAGNGAWGKAMHNDLLDAVQYAVDNGVTRADNVCIVGGSYGGYATLAGLTLTPEQFKCGVDIVGPSNLITLMKSIPAYWAPLMAQFKQRVGDHETDEGRKALLAVSPLTHADKIVRPLLIGQGANDPRVKQAESEQIVAAMQKANRPVSYALFPDEGHGFARPENNLAFLGVVEAFLSAHLGGEYQPLTAAELAASSMQIKAGALGIPGLPTTSAK